MLDGAVNREKQLIPQIIRRGEFNDSPFQLRRPTIEFSVENSLLQRTKANGGLQARKSYIIFLTLEKNRSSKGSY